MKNLKFYDPRLKEPFETDQYEVVEKQTAQGADAVRSGKIPLHRSKNLQVARQEEITNPFFPMS